MESLLPSEIARLVLGYLEDQQCSEAAKQFLESSFHLQECRTVLAHGKRFNTKVNGLTLMDIIEKFCAINAIIQERLNKVTDCEQLKHCGDLIEQLKFLVEEPRGQRFVVNINVPSQNNTQTSSGSPVIANNLRRRRHSNSERNKRQSNIKSQSNTTQQSDIVTTSPPQNIDTTPLESLPGNVVTSKETESANDTIEKSDDNVAQESPGQYDLEKNDGMWSTQQFAADIDGTRKEINITTSTPSLKRCTTATNTEELLRFSSTEVQTNPYELPESESESNDEPIENLSILTKEILNRTELQECIAENINRAIIPADLSLRDEFYNDSVGGEGNTSIMAELNSAIKSIVEATETDPVFEKFLDEIFGPHTETDTSPEEDGEGKHSPKFLNEAEEQHVDAAFGNISSPDPTITDTRASADAADVPLKHRLRSSSRQQNNRTEDETEKVRDQEKEQNTLEDQNAAAVLCIVNAANYTNNAIAPSEKKTLDDVKESTIVSDIAENNVKVTIAAAVSKEDTTKSLTPANVPKASSASGNVESKMRKSTVKRPRPTRPKRDQAISDNQVMTKEEIITTPALVVCSKEEISNLLGVNHSSAIRSTSTSRFIPIAPKSANKIAGPVETMYLRAVNLAQKLPRSLPSVKERGAETPVASQASSQKKASKVSKTVKTVRKVDATLTPVIADQRSLSAAESVQMITKIATGESQVITLYGNNENSAKTSLDSANMPTISLDENISLSESGFSPYLKFNCSKTSQNHNLSDIDLTSMMEITKCTTATITTTTATLTDTTAEQQPTFAPNTDVIAKRTPKSLLKNRPKNSRLSLSTPRKRSSHIRALDFSTPPKVISSARKVNANEATAQFSSVTTKRLKSVCRTSLFKSPPFSGSPSITAPKQPSPMKVYQSYKIPIATRSPAPKLMGGWDKYNGVGVIIGDVSSHGSTSASSSSEDRAQHKTSKAPTESWDADLRKGIQSSKKDETEVKKPAKRKHPSNPKDENDATHKRARHSQQSTKNRNRKKTEATDEPHLREDPKAPTTERTHGVVTFSAGEPSKSDPIVASADAPAAKTNGASAPGEKKPVKKYVQLKTIRTNLKKPTIGEDTEGKTNSARVTELSKILSASSAQRMLRMPDIIDIETPRKLNTDGTSAPPPTPRMLSPGNNAVTPFIKLSEDSSKLRSSFIRTPEFPITPGIALTPKEETTRDVVKKDEYSSPYYKPSCEQTAVSADGLSKFKSIPAVSLSSPVISSSHIKLHSTHNSLAAADGVSYHTCTTSTTKLEITQFEVIKENLPKEEAIKELKIASNPSTKDSSTEPNAVSSCAFVVAAEERPEGQVDEQLPGGDHHREASIIDDNYAAASGSSSSTDVSSDSSSSSSTSTSDSSSSCSSPDGKSSPSPTKSVNEEPTAAAGNDEPKPAVEPAVEDDSSPKKVFAIEKTDEQLQATSQETPAKDESLLNEADISETPSSSKAGVESLTNLSTKILAIITEDEKQSKLNKPAKDCAKTQTFSRVRAKPKVTSVQCIRPESSRAVVEELLRPSGDAPGAQGAVAPAFNKLVAQLEEKRQRMIAKFRDAPKSKLAGGATRKRMLMSKASNDARTKGAQFATRLNARQTVRQPHDTRNCEDKPAATEEPPSQTASRDGNPTKNTRKKCELQKPSSEGECGSHDEETRKQPAASRNVDPPMTTMPSTSHASSDRPFDDVAAHASNDDVKSDPLEVTGSAQPSSQERSRSRERSDSKEKSCGLNVVRDDPGETLADDDAQPKVPEKEEAVERHVVAEETLVGDKAEPRDRTEERTLRQHLAAHVDKVKCILKSKVDQVKRDLFSDEENDQRESAVCVATTQRDKTANKRTEETRQSSTAADQVPCVSRENVHVENHPKEKLSSVLQCLQLVPAHKSESEQTQDGKQQQQEDRSEDKGECKGTSEVADTESDQRTANVHHYKAEYHFVYDDSAPIRKRRRRYSGHELQIEINYADLSDPNPVESIKVLRATEFEEIFNLPPKNTKKRTLSKKTSHKTEKTGETIGAKADNEVLKDNVTKPLAASSPMDETLAAKTKKPSTKTAAANRAVNDAQVDLKKKPKPDKTQEKVLEIAAKSRKRKLSETKETKQIDRKSCATDPQTLLSNIDLNKFLATVHGPE